MIGAQLDDKGWIGVDDLLVRMAAAGTVITLATLNDIVTEDKKNRYEFSVNGRRIRARQGHSVPVDLEMEAGRPPDILYHGTSLDRVASIMQTGINAVSRLYVHLSTDVKTAEFVGRRHGVPVVLTVFAKSMHDDGHTFFLSTNGVWLVESVPAVYIQTPTVADVVS